MKEKEEREQADMLKEEKAKAFKENAAKQRMKIKDLKRDELLKLNESEPMANEINESGRQQKLTEENLMRNEAAVAEERKKPQSKAGNPSQQKKSKKPMWAMTEKELENTQEKEVDDLLEFAYELDYEKYMEDFEVR